MNQQNNLISLIKTSLLTALFLIFFSHRSTVIAADHDHKKAELKEIEHNHQESFHNAIHSHEEHEHNHDSKEHPDEKHTHQHDEHESHDFVEHDFIEAKPIKKLNPSAQNLKKPDIHEHEHGQHSPKQIKTKDKAHEDDKHDHQQKGVIDHKHTHEEQENHNHQQVNDEKNHEHEHEENEEAELKFSAAELEEFSITLAQAKSGIIKKTLDLTGEVIVAPEQLHHVVPRVSGVVRQLFKHLGDDVKTGELLATLSSRELADAKAQYVAANSLLQLANARLNREHNLYKNKVTSKRNYLAAKQAQTEIFIKRKAAKQQLLTIGLTENTMLSILKNTDKDLTLYELRAPADGIIIEKHAAIGEVLETDTRSFTLADLSQVWVNLTVYQKDLPFIQQGQQVVLSTRFSENQKEPLLPNTISWISPVLEESTRSASARVIIDNTTGIWRPGLFVSGKVNISNTKANVVIPLSALQTIKGQTVVFVQHSEGEFEPQVIQTGRKDHQQVEVLQGLKTGQTYVSKNAFSLKAQLQKDSFGHGHSH